MALTPALIFFLSQLLGNAGELLRSVEDQFPQERVPAHFLDVEDVAPIDDGDFLAVVHRPSTFTDLWRVGPRGDEQIAALPKMAPQDLAQSIVVNDGRWWFGRMGQHVDHFGASVFFVEGPSARVKELQFDGWFETWMTVRGPRPRAIGVTVEMEQPALWFWEATQDHVQPVASFDWFQSARWFNSLHDSLWAAEALDGDRAAVVAVDRAEENPILVLRTFGDGEPRESNLHCDVAAQPIAIAVDEAGRMAVVAASKKLEVVAVIIDPDNPEAAECRAITGPGEVIDSLVPFGSPELVATSNGFVASWAREDGRIRACEFAGLDASPRVFEVADHASTKRMLRQMIHPDRDSIRFIWKDVNDDIYERALPADLNAYAFIVDLGRLLCGDCDTQE